MRRLVPLLCVSLVLGCGANSVLVKLEPDAQYEPRATIAVKCIGLGPDPLRLELLLEEYLGKANFNLIPSTDSVATYGTRYRLEFGYTPSMKTAHTISYLWAMVFDMENHQIVARGNYQEGDRARSSEDICREFVAKLVRAIKGKEPPEEDQE
jgi:hypothetical protein